MNLFAKSKMVLKRSVVCTPVVIKIFKELFVCNSSINGLYDCFAIIRLNIKTAVVFDDPYISGRITAVITHISYLPRCMKEKEW